MCDMRTQDKAVYRKFLDEIGEEYCEKGRYCIFKELLIATRPSRRMLTQLKIIDRVKIEKSEKAGKDIGWDGAFRVWSEEGLDAKFANIYTDDKNVKGIYKEMFR